jgi:hypothetical protein
MRRVGDVMGRFFDMCATRELVFAAFVAMYLSSVLITVMCAGVTPVALWHLSFLCYAMLYVLLPLIFIGGSVKIALLLYRVL